MAHHTMSLNFREPWGRSMTLSSSQKPPEATPPIEACQPSFHEPGWSRESVSGPWVGLGEVLVAARVGQGVSELRFRAGWQKGRGDQGLGSGTGLGSA